MAACGDMCTVDWFLKIKKRILPRDLRETRSDPGDLLYPEPSLHGHVAGQTVHWALRGASYGMRGAVVRGGGARTEPCLVVSFQGDDYHVKLCAVSTRRQVKKRQPRGPRKGNTLHGMKGVVVGESDAFSEPSLLVAFKGADYHVKVNAIATRSPKNGVRATPPFKQANASHAAPADWGEEIDDASPQVVDVGGVPSAGREGRRAAVGPALPCITIGARLLFAALLNAACGPICIRKALKHVQRPDHDAGPDKYLVHVFFHFVAVKVFEDGYDVIDGDQRCQFDGPISSLETFLGSDATWYRVVDIGEISDQGDVTDTESDSDRRAFGAMLQRLDDAEEAFDNGEASPRSIDIDTLIDVHAFDAYLRRLYLVEEASSHSGDSDLDVEPFDALPQDDDLFHPRPNRVPDMVAFLDVAGSDGESTRDGDAILEYTADGTSSTAPSVDTLGGMDSVELHTAETKRRILDKWEPEKFRRLQARSGPTLVSDVEPAKFDVRAAVSQVINKTNELLQAWDPQPAGLEYFCLRVIAMCVMERLHWNPTNDLLIARIAALALDDTIAHPDGVYLYRQGSFGRVEDLPTAYMYKIERVLSVTQIVLLRIMNGQVPRDLVNVFQFLESDAGNWEVAQLVCSSDLQVKKEQVADWAFDACRGCQQVICRFTGKGQSEKLVDLLGAWFH
ncbi:unnamed protein product, partial [Prorocentrum cordatum]